MSSSSLCWRRISILAYVLITTAVRDFGLTSPQLGSSSQTASIGGQPGGAISTQFPARFEDRLRPCVSEAVATQIAESSGLEFFASSWLALVVQH